MRAPGLLLILLSLTAAGCAPEIDLTKGLVVSDFSTGLIDGGIVNGQNRLVPVINLRLKNVSDQALIALQVNAVFRKAGETDEWGSGYKIISQSPGLAPGATTDLITIQSSLGYTGAEPRADMLKNPHYVDLNVQVAAKYAAAEWKRIVERPVDRRLLLQ